MKTALSARPPGRFHPGRPQHGVRGAQPSLGRRTPPHRPGLGFGQPRVLGGHEGLRELDEDGRHHGALCRLARLLQGLTRERDFIEAYAAHLYAGHLVVWIPSPAHARLAELKLAFEQWGGHAVLRHSLPA